MGYYDFGKEEKYIITYKDLTGKECIIEGTASSRFNAEILFRRKFVPACKIIKIQTSNEWVDEKVKEIVDNLMKHTRNLESVVGD